MLCSGPRFLHQLAVRDGALLDGTLEKPVKQQPPMLSLSAVESERELVEIVVQMLVADRSLMGTQQPAFQQRGDSVARGQQILSHVRLLARNLMRVSESWQLAVSTPSVCSDHRSTLRGLLHGRFQTGCRGIRDTAKPDSSDASIVDLRRNHDQRFPGGTPSALARPLSTYICFIHLHNPLQRVSPRPDHGTPQPMQPGPCRSVTAQSEDSLDPQGARAVLLPRHPPDCPKPQRQRLMRPVKDGTGDDRRLVVTPGTLEQHRTDRPSLPMVTQRARKPRWPAQPKQVVSTRFLRREPRFELRKRPGVVVHGAQILHLEPT